MQEITYDQHGNTTPPNSLEKDTKLETTHIEDIVASHGLNDRDLLFVRAHSSLHPDPCSAQLTALPLLFFTRTSRLFKPSLRTR